MKRVINNFEIIDFYSYFGNKIFYLRHNITDINILYIIDKINNSSCTISLKTPLFSNNGVSHVLEHCITNEIYEKNSEFLVNNELNIYTLIDRTNYSFISSKDNFYSRIKLFLSCIFSSSILEDKNMFYKEAWRWDLLNKTKVKGVVVNEMNRMFNSSQLLLYKCLPFCTELYGFIPGGTPSGILDLTHNELVHYYSKFYTYENSSIFIHSGEGINDFTKKMNDILSNQYKLMSHKKSIGIKNKELSILNLKVLDIGEYYERIDGTNILIIPSNDKKKIFSVNYAINKPKNIIDYLFYEFIKIQIFESKKFDIICNTKIEYPYMSFYAHIDNNTQIGTCIENLEVSLNKIIDDYCLFADFFKKNYKNYLSEYLYNIILDLHPYDFNIIDFLKIDISSQLKHENYLKNLNINYTNNKPKFLLINNKKVDINKLKKKRI